MRNGLNAARSRLVIGVVVVLASVSACSRGGSTPAGAETSSAATTVADDLFDEYDLAIDDDVIIGTEDGSIPTSSTVPPPGAPDVPPPENVLPTTVPPVALPEPADVNRIVSLSPTHTETLFALGLGDLVVAVDKDSDFPQAALAVRNGALGVEVANIEPLLALKPDLVIVGDDPTGVVGRLNAAGVASYSGPQADSLDEVYTQIRDIAALVGRPDAAEQLVSSMQGEVDAIVAALPPGAAGAGLTFFHEIDPSLFTVGNDSFLSDVYSTLGLKNIAGPGGDGQVTQMTNDEVIVADPDVIVLADFECCAVDAERLATRPGWSNLAALRDGAVVPLSDALAMRWGPRVVELLRLVADGVSSASF